MSNINRTYLTHQGVRKQPTNHFVGVDGAWKKIRYRLIAVDGKWVEVFDNENNLPGILGFSTLNKRSVYPDELLEATGDVLETYPELDTPTLANGFYYPLFYNLYEVSNLGRPAAKLYDPYTDYNYLTLNGKGLKLVGYNPQGLVIPTFPNGGIDLPTLLGSTGNDEFHLSFQFKLGVLPYPKERVYLFYAGIPGERFAIYFKTAINAFCFLWEDGGAVYDSGDNSSENDAVDPTNFIGVYFSKFSNSKNFEFCVKDGAQGKQLKYSGSLGGVNQSPRLTHEEGEILYGVGYETVVAPVEKPYFTGANRHPEFAVYNQFTLVSNSDAYRTAQPGRVIYQGTGIYVVVVRNLESHDLQLGVGEVGADLSLSAGNSGWCINTLGLNKFNHQSNGGEYLGVPIADAPNIGMIYNSNDGSLRYFTDGESWEAFPPGSITVPVKLLISGRGNSALGKQFRVTMSLVKGTFTSPLSMSLYKEFPKEYESSQYSTLSTPGTFRDIFIGKGVNVRTALDSLTTYTPAKEGLNWLVRNISNSWGFRQDDDNLINVDPGKVSLYVPSDCPPDSYLLRYATPRLGGWTDDKHITVHPLPLATEDLNIDFTTTSAAIIRDSFLCWGESDFVDEPVTGGTVWDKANVTHNAALGGVILKAQASLQTFDSTGRHGGRIVTAKYYGPGSYRVVAKLPASTDVLSTFFTRQFEYGIDGSEKFKSHRTDGIAYRIHAGKRYTPRRHGIGLHLPAAFLDAEDIEVVEYKKTTFNTRITERDENLTAMVIDHGKQLDDGLFHEFRFDWHIEPTPRVDFYIDGVLITTIVDNVPDIIGRLHVGLSFPWKSNTWTNKPVTQLEEQMVVRSISITRFQQTVREIGESYPNRGLRDFFS